MARRILAMFVAILMITGTVQIALGATMGDVDIANQFTYPGGNGYCSITADTIRAFNDSRGEGYMFGET